MIINVQLRSSRENFIGGRAVSKKQGCFLGAGRYKEVRERSVNPHLRVAKRVFRFRFRVSSPKLGDVSLATEGCVNFRYRYRFR